jgi:Tfp pilus assembly protein PilF
MRRRRGHAVNATFIMPGEYLPPSFPAAEDKALCVAADPAALYSSAVEALRRGETAAAIGLLERAVAIAPDHAAAHEALGFGLQQAGRSEEALAALRRAVSLAPHLATAFNLIGIELLSRGDPAEGLAAFEAALAARPAYAEAQINAGLALQKLKRLEAARKAFLRAAKLKPNWAEAENALGTVLQQLGRPEQAVAAYRRAIAHKPDFAASINNLGRSLRDLGKVEAAIAQYTKAIALDPCYAAAHWNRALLNLLSGRFAEGWEEQEWRWKVEGFPSTPRHFAPPLWRGESIAGQTILLHAEQGFGDTFQFLRYVPLVAETGARIVLEVQPQLAPLAAALPGVTQLVVRGTPLPPFDWHAPLLSLPRAFATTLETIPATVPYLSADPALVGRWRARISRNDTLQVGLVWAGSPTHGNDRNRSVDLSLLAPLLEIPDTCFYSLQIGATRKLPAGLVDLSAELDTFAESAAALTCLDLLISVDTSSAHLAGALGVPVWTLIPFAPDWRWLLEREDSPWYPSMHLFRQKKRGDWAGVVKRVARKLSLLATAHRADPRGGRGDRTAPSRPESGLVDRTANSAKIEALSA